MKVLAANIEDVMREAAARWTLLAYFFLSTIFIIIFASAVNLDIVDGALAGAKLFGKEVTPDSGISIDKLVLGFEIGFSGFLYIFCTLLAVFATAHLVPRMQDKGTVDLYLSRPVGRVRLLLARYVAGLILASSNVIYLMGTVWIIVAWKTRVAHPRFLLGGAIILLVIAVMLAFAFLVGVITSSTAVSIMMTVGFSIFSAMLVMHENFAAAVSHEWQAKLINGMYWVLPKTSELMQAVVAFVGGDQVPDRMLGALNPSPFLTTAAFGIVCLSLASWLFTRKEF
ncbi:MAG TPA: ABC transporter permease subunit [Thermoanaerobaculia bacterium]|nr:ABC transporter permease subunit [Thermoanaerobaculia bacterium]